MLYSLNESPLVDFSEEEKSKEKIKKIKAEINATKKLLKLMRQNPDVSGYVNKYSNNKQFDEFQKRIKRVYEDILAYTKSRNAEENRKQKLESLIQELNSLNREIEQGNVICAKCGSDRIIYKNREMSFEVSNPYVRKNILNSIKYRIEQKKEAIREYTRQIKISQDELKSLLIDVPVELHKVLLFSETILSEINYDDKLNDLSEQLKELQNRNKSLSNTDKATKEKCKRMTDNIIQRMNVLYKEVDPYGRLRFDDFFTKKDETISGSEEQEYYYSRVLAINDYFKHEYPLLIDCYRSGEISSQKEDIMINNFIARNKQVIITSTLKQEEYNSQKYNKYSDKATILDYSSNESSKLLQSKYVEEFREIVNSFGVILEE